MTTGTAGKKYTVEKNPLGFYEIMPKPTIQELQQFYADHYFQTGGGGYELKYNETELAYFHNKIEQKYLVLSRLRGKKTGSFLDVGCGEGWSMGYFKRKGWQVTGLDFSTFACEKFNPDCLENLVTGDFYDSMEQLAKEGKTFDCVWSLSVLEHVTDPVRLLNSFMQLVAKDGYLVIQVPNDFSTIQELLLEKGYFSEKFWIAPPDHLIYFNRDGLRSTMDQLGWDEQFLMGDYWIEMNLMNSHSNYMKDRALGKEAHRARIAAENLLHELSPEKAIDLFQKSAEIGLGRNLVGFYKKK